MSDEDLAAIVAYARSLPRSATVQPAASVGPVPRVMHLSGAMDLLSAEVIDHGATHVRRCAWSPTVRYGAYIAVGCTGCHGAGFSGGQDPGGAARWGPAANITPAGIGSWSEADFVRALRTGVRPDGSKIDGSVMPLKVYKDMDEVELRAIYAYLRTVPPKPFGNR
jgi:mono/diheme cytochrome c family protein